MKTSFIVLMIFTLCLWNKEVHSSANQPIVSAGGSITEILFALGQADKIVASDTSSLYPQAAHALPKVGYYRQMSPEGILSTGAKLLITHSGAGPDSALKQLENAGMQVHVLESPRTINGLLSLIQQLGELTNSEARAQVLMSNIETQRETLRQRYASVRDRKVAFLMSANQQGFNAAGQDTVPNLLFEELGMLNVVADIQGYKQVSAEVLLLNPPERILLPQHRVNGQSAQQLCQQTGLRLYASKYGCNVEIVDSLLFLGLTPRLPEAMQKIAQMME